MQNDIHSTMLRSMLAEWCIDAADTQIEPRGASTGLSGALVWRVSPRGKTLCLKRWPREHPTPDELASVHGLLQHVAQSGFQFVPTPVVTRSGQSLVRRDGHLWELTPWLPGEPYDRNQPSLEKRLTAMRCLAQFHRTASLYESPVVAVAPGLLTRREILRGLRGDLVQLRLAVGAKPASELRTVAEEMLVQIERALPTVLGELELVVDVPLPLQWCLRDVKCDHVLFTGEQVSGLIDFGAAAVDSVAGDVARLVGSLVGDDRQEWPPAIEAYHDCRPLSPDERRAVDCFDRGGTLAAASNWLRWLFVEERSFSHADVVQAQLVHLCNRLRAL